MRPKSYRTAERMAFGASLAMLRAKTGHRQSEVADEAGITKAMLSSYERGNSFPSLESLQAILQALGADFRDLQAAIDARNGDMEALNYPLRSDREQRRGRSVRRS